MLPEVKFATITHPGLVRSNNEDVIEAGSFTMSDTAGLRCRLHYMAVCDGMGGAKAGETASKLALVTMVDYVKAMPFWPRLDKDILDELKKGVIAAHQNIVMLSGFDSDKDGMATTLVFFITDGYHAYVVWSGDSRAYLLSETARMDNKYGVQDLYLLTRDHSVVWQNVLDGILTPDQAKNHPTGQALTQSLGVKSYPNPDGIAISTTYGDRFLLCSDGLALHVNIDEIRRILKENTLPEGAINKLSEVILARGARDNFSLGVIDIEKVEIIKPGESKQRSGPKPVAWIILACIGGCGLWYASKWAAGTDARITDDPPQNNIPAMTAILNENAQRLKSAFDGMSGLPVHEASSRGEVSTNAGQLMTVIRKNASEITRFSNLRKEYQDLIAVIDITYANVKKSEPEPDIQTQSYMIRLDVLKNKLRHASSTLERGTIQEAIDELRNYRKDLDNINNLYKKQMN